jgi:hypothetical protein
MTVDKDYALLLLARTRLTYSQISDLTGIGINKLGTWAQDHRPKHIRDENIVNGTKPDIQEELMKLKQEMEKEIPEELHQEVPEVAEPQAMELVFIPEESPQRQPGSEKDIVRSYSFEYSVKTNRPVDKSILLAELNRIAEQIESIDTNEVHLHINIEGA